MGLPAQQLVAFGLGNAVMVWHDCQNNHEHENEDNHEEAYNKHTQAHIYVCEHIYAHIER